GSGHVGAELGQEDAEQCRLPGADVAGDADEAARLGEPEPQVRERLGVLAREKEVSRIGRQPERLLLQPARLLWHSPHHPRGAKIAVFIFVIYARSLLFALYRRSSAAGAIA